MKQAGLANDSAWFRINKKIKKQFATDPGSATNLATQINEIESAQQFLDALLEMATEAGIPLDDETIVTSDLGDLATTYATKGIPRQVWVGNMSFDTYLPKNSELNPKDYPVKKHAAITREFAGDLRAVISRWFRTRRALIDMRNVRSRAQGNPSGVADATKST